MHELKYQAKTMYVLFLGILCKIINSCFNIHKVPRNVIINIKIKFSYLKENYLEHYGKSSYKSDFNVLNCDYSILMTCL